MKTKDGVAKMFLTFKGEAEKQTGSQIMSLRSDNGGEYLSNIMISKGNLELYTRQRHHILLVKWY